MAFQHRKAKLQPKFAFEFSSVPQSNTEPSTHTHIIFQHLPPKQNQTFSSYVLFLPTPSKTSAYYHISSQFPKTKPSFQFILTKAVPFSVLKSNISRCSNSHFFPHLEAKLQPLFIFLFSTSKQSFRLYSYFSSVPRCKTKPSVHTYLAFQCFEAKYQPLFIFLFSTSKQNFRQCSYFFSAPQGKTKPS